MTDWEPETQALIDTAGLEVTSAKVNVAVRQWLRQVLRHRDYLQKVKADPERRKRFEANRQEYQREYRRHGPKRRKKIIESMAKKRRPIRTLPIRKPLPEDDMCYRIQKLAKEKRADSKDVLILGGM